ncbi:hypothetical protein SAMN04487895_10388 [Paenibacillus sophorae]|uniref:Uncharacterized protein n=1 Tax=Paenibacillus sophorae TaxID=1333845 RepID=A0A1H8JN43_9BACL|nr:hypothetical protein [Paenibacillus sophorae]QWU13424.1 hypothetical protein KP014_15600 [Paenibacillus sophorae]SEN82130.1 hypothetical protein SAMN04487895_10388 [Paenibacillus sophorae]
MKNNINWGIKLFDPMYPQIKTFAKNKLNDGIDNGDFVFINGFDCRPLFESILIEVAKKRKLSVVINKDIERVTALQNKYNYKHIYNPMSIMKADHNRPHEIIISDNVQIESFDRLESDTLISGFRKKQRDRGEN